MRTRIFSGVEYMKATEIARMHHYAPDYIGQLCRTGKIEARLAGRTWYATEASFKAYQSGRYGGQTAASVALSEGRETTPKAKREAVAANAGTELPAVPKISVTKTKPAAPKKTATKKSPAKKAVKVAAPAPKRAVTKKAATKKAADRKVAITARITEAPEVPAAPAPAPEAKGIKGLFRKLFGR